MRWKASLLVLLPFFSLFQTPSYATEQIERCKIVMNHLLNPDETLRLGKMRFGDGVEAFLPNGSKRALKVIGAFNHPESPLGEQFLFFDPINKSLVMAHPDRVELYGFEPQKLRFFGRQTAPTCALESTMTCLDFLKDVEGALPESVINELTYDREKLRQYFLPIATKEYKSQWKEDPLGYAKRAVTAVFTNTPPSLRLREELLRRRNIKFEVLPKNDQTGITKVVQHLAAGRPVIIDYNQQRVPIPFEDLTSGFSATMQQAQPARSMGARSAHSVAALGIVGDTSAGKVHILVYDTDDGFYMVWDIKTLLNALPNSIRFTLIGAKGGEKGGPK